MSVDFTKAKASDIGKEQPTEASKEKVTDIVNDIVSDITSEPNVEALEESVPKSEEAPEETKLPEKEEKGEDQDESSDEEAESTETESEEEVENEEELVPKSRVQERIDKLTAKVKALEAEKEQLANKPSSKKSREEQLEEMSLQDLRTLRKNTRRALRTATDEANIDQLEDLEETVEDKISTYSQRSQTKFIRNQNENLMGIVPELIKIDPAFKNGKGDLWNITNRIYSRSKALQNSEMGKVDAAVLAAEYFSSHKQATSVGETKKDLSKQVQSLKKKTSLEGKTHVAQQKAVSNRNLLDKARKGDMIDKENFFREALVPDHFLKI